MVAIAAPVLCLGTGRSKLQRNVTLDVMLAKNYLNSHVTKVVERLTARDFDHHAAIHTGDNPCGGDSRALRETWAFDHFQAAIAPEVSKPPGMHQY